MKKLFIILFILLPLECNGIYVMGEGGGFVGSVQNMAAGKVKEGYATSGTGNPNVESSCKLKK